MITAEDRKKLLKLARKSIETYLSNKELKVDGEIKQKYSKEQGAFVTLKTKEGNLRGCIGYPTPILPLYEAIIKAARAAAFEDPRFEPLQREELKNIVVEISVLTVPKLIKVKHPTEYLEKIKIGKDGLIIESPFGSGLLLPQVFVEYHTTPKQALEMLCEKAGLPGNEWQNPLNKIYKFQAEVFSEKGNKERSKEDK